MSSDQIQTVLSRVPSWPQAQQEELVELALDIEGELTGSAYHATDDELRAIDEGLAGKAARADEVEEAFDRLR